MRRSRRFGPSAVHLVCGTVAVTAFVCFGCVRPNLLRWGASDVEVAQSMPGDRVVGGADFVATRAVTIDAPPELVWPLIVRMGQRDGRFVKGFEANRYVLWVTRSTPRLTWCWRLEPSGPGRTRLVTRVRFRHSWLPAAVFRSLAADVANLLAGRRAMLDVKAGAETAARKPRRDT